MKLVQEFKAFITRGNILDMAVGVIVGGAFNTIVTTLNKQILMPVVNWALSFITDGECLYTIMPNSVLATADDIANGAATVLGPNGKSYTVLNYINWSAFFESIINFFFINRLSNYRSECLLSTSCNSYRKVSQAWKAHIK